MPEIETKKKSIKTEIRKTKNWGKINLINSVQSWNTFFVSFFKVRRMP
jgi:hypothetical protein